VLPNRPVQRDWSSPTLGTTLLNGKVVGRTSVDSMLAERGERGGCPGVNQADSALPTSCCDHLDTFHRKFVPRCWGVTALLVLLARGCSAGAVFVRWHCATQAGASHQAQGPIRLSRGALPARYNQLRVARRGAVASRLANHERSDLSKHTWSVKVYEYVPGTGVVVSFHLR
jgi:hypothetical protein